MDGISVSFCLYFEKVSKLFTKIPTMICNLFEDTELSSFVGTLELQNCQLDAKKNSGGLKRKKEIACLGGSSYAKTVKKDVGQIFEDLNIVPDMGSGLQCALCPYVASQKGNLKTHYKLKHLGGADLAVNCSMCQKRCTTKGNLKRHLMQVHSMSVNDAAKLIN